MNRLSKGKLPISVLRDTVLKMTGSPSHRLVMGPEAGVDFGVVRVDDGYMLVSADPITGTSSNIGWYAVNVNANDIATSGNRPRFMESVVLLPEGATKLEVATIAGQMDRSAKSLGITIVGGHTEVTPRLDRPIVVVTAFTFVKDYVSSAGAKPGDTIMMTKSAGLEGTSILVRESERRGIRVEQSILKGARVLEGQLSVVREAVKAYRTGVVHGMHDCTEGGVEGAVFEMALASKTGFELHEGDVPLAPTTKVISKALSIDPLRLIGSGALLIAVERGKESKVHAALRGTCEVSAVGRFVDGGRVVVQADGTEKRMRNAPTDELWRALAELG